MIEITETDARFILEVLESKCMNTSPYCGSESDEYRNICWNLRDRVRKHLDRGKSNPGDETPICTL